MLSLILLSFFLFSGCPDSGVNPPPNPLGLTVENVTSTQAFLKLSLDQGETQRAVTLKRGDSTVFSDLRLLTSDTLVVDEGLLPNKTYTYTLVKDNWTATAQATTMDTTSHDFTWTVTQLTNSGGTLYDVAIVNDTLAYAVGEMYMYDSTGQYDPQPYNLAVWNGQAWSLKKVTVSFRGNRITPPLEGIFCFSSTQIWLVGSLPIYGDGSNWVMYDLRTTLDSTISVSKAWGINSQNMYFVGRGGSIVHYALDMWAKLSSGTDTYIDDIFGVINKKINKEEAYCAVTDFFQAKDKKILKITNTTTVDSIPWTTGRGVVTVWSADGSFLYAGGDGMFENSTGVWKEINYGAHVYINHIRGNAANDVFAVADFGIVTHFNGSTWKTFYLAPNADFNSVAVKGNLVIAVGTIRTTVAVGKRN